MKAEERRRQERILSAYQGMLDTLNRIGPTSESHEDLEAFGEVKDYLLDCVEQREDILRNARSGRAFSRPRGNGLHPVENVPDNRTTSGAENA